MHTHACTRTHAHTYFTVFFLPYICLLKGKHSCAFHAILIYFSYMVKTRYFIPFPSCPHLQQVISAIPNQSSDKNHVSSRIRSFSYVSESFGSNLQSIFDPYLSIFILQNLFHHGNQRLVCGSNMVQGKGKRSVWERKTIFVTFLVVITKYLTKAT